MAVSIRGEQYSSVDLGADCSSEEAEYLAMELYANIGAKSCFKALVDRHDGLLLLYTDGPTRRMDGRHFRTAIAGYVGRGPQASAFILNLFGFGARDEIFEKISRGENDAFYVFVK